MSTTVHPGAGAGPDTKIRFGPFELGLRNRVLRREGRRIRLQEQPFQILHVLLESPGEIVSREDIRKRLWPDDTVVEFDHSINVAVRRLRDALRESADKPRYIETVARRGYRFIGELEPAGRPPAVSEPVASKPAAVLTLTHSPDQAPGPASRPAPLHLRASILVVLACAILLIAWAGIEYNLSRVRSAAIPLQPLMRLDLDLPDAMPAASEPGVTAILSPDGSRLAYVARSKLFIRRLDQPDATALPGTENARRPFFSPDGQWLAFFMGEDLKKVSLRGEVTFIGKCPLGNGGSWGEDGTIVAGCNFTLSTFASGGGEPAPLTQLAAGEIVHRWPQALPGGKAVVFTAYPSVTGLDGARIEVISLSDRRRKTLVRGGTSGRYLPSGHLAYTDKGTLFAARFDPDRLEVLGTPAPVLGEVAYSTAWGSAQIDLSRTGTLVYRSSRTGEGLVTVQWLDASGTSRPLVPLPGNYLSPTLSPDGRRIALTSGGDIWVYELGRGSMTRLTFGGGYGNPLWSADGRYIVFRSGRGMLWTRADGTAQPQVLTESSNQQTPWSFTADGKRLAFVEIVPGTGADIWTLPMESGPSGLRPGKPELFLQTPFQERAPMISPDGRWIAFQSNESGEYHVYVQGFLNKSVKRRVSVESSGYPAWSRNGRELFFWQLGTPGQLMAVSYQSHGDSFVADKPRVWSTSIAHFGTTRSFDPAPDGKHVVALTAARATGEPHDRVVFLLNFFDELRRRVPSAAYSTTVNTSR